MNFLDSLMQGFTPAYQSMFKDSWDAAQKEKEAQRENERLLNNRKAIIDYQNQADAMAEAQKAGRIARQNETASKIFNNILSGTVPASEPQFPYADPYRRPMTSGEQQDALSSLMGIDKSWYDRAKDYLDGQRPNYNNFDFGKNIIGYDKNSGTFRDLGVNPNYVAPKDERTEGYGVVQWRDPVTHELKKQIRVPVAPRESAGSKDPFDKMFNDSVKTIQDLQAKRDYAKQYNYRYTDNSNKDASGNPLTYGSDDLDKQIDRLTSEMASKVKQNMGSGALEVYKSLYNVNGKKNPSPESFLENVANAYTKGVIDKGDVRKFNQLYFATYKKMPE